MDSLRILPGRRSPRVVPCSRCASGERHWDWIVDKPYCPECQEALILGIGAPLKEKTEKNHCAVCGCFGTVRYLTFPLHSLTPLEMDLCPEHLRNLLGRCLKPYAFQQLRRRLRALGLKADSIFLLHEAFYDESGQALQPAVEPD